MTEACKFFKVIDLQLKLQRKQGELDEILVGRSANSGDLTRKLMEEYEDIRMDREKLKDQCRDFESECNELRQTLIMAQEESRTMQIQYESELEAQRIKIESMEHRQMAAYQQLHKMAQDRDLLRTDREVLRQQWEESCANATRYRNQKYWKISVVGGVLCLLSKTFFFCASCVKQLARSNSIVNALIKTHLVIYGVLLSLSSRAYLVSSTSIAHTIVSSPYHHPQIYLSLINYTNLVCSLIKLFLNTLLIHNHYKLVSQTFFIHSSIYTHAFVHYRVQGTPLFARSLLSDCHLLSTFV